MDTPSMIYIICHFTLDILELMSGKCVVQESKEEECIKNKKDGVRMTTILRQILNNKMTITMEPSENELRIYDQRRG